MPSPSTSRTPWWARIASAAESGCERQAQADCPSQGNVCARMTSPDNLARPARRSRAAGRPPLAEVAYRQVKRRILDNAFPPGAHVLEVELTAELGMSRTPVREALVRLQNEGLVEIVPRHGVRVLPISSEDMREIYEILGALETTAIELIAERGETAGLDRLEDAVATMEEALAADDLDAWAEADERFHQALVDMCGNRRLKKIALDFWDQTHRVRALTLRLRPRPKKSTEHHRALVRALRHGDVETAHRIHWNQRKRSCAELVRLLKHYNLSHL